VKDRYLLERDGRTLVLYAGLLDAAHEQGVLSIETQVLQLPTADNGQTAVCFATVTMPGAGEGAPPRRFTGVGDANPGNVGRLMVPHLLRMSETRAKARALRDAVNVGELLSDDPTDLDDAEPPVRMPERPAERRPAAAPAAPAPAPRPRQTPREWYEAARPLAAKHGIAAPPLAADAPDDYVLEQATALKAALVKAGALPGATGEAKGAAR
jgi:hypothetical protein